MLYFLESLKLPLFTLLCTQGSASEWSFWYGRKKWDSHQYRLAVHFYLEMGFSWTKQKPAAYFLKACTEFWANPSTFKTKMHKENQLPQASGLGWRDSFVCPSFLAFSALLLNNGHYFYFSHYERRVLDPVIFVMACPKPWIFIFSWLQAKKNGNMVRERQVFICRTIDDGAKNLLLPTSKHTALLRVLFWSGFLSFWCFFFCSLDPAL